MIGRTIDRYRVMEQLGQGGMGVVYKARDTVLDRFVALKVLPPNLKSDPERRRRFLQEAKSASALNHPGIVSVFDLLSVDDQDLLVMELVEGETLENLLARRRPPLSEALGLAARIADALGRAHAAGIVHRDLKPSNVMVTSDGVKVLDFGLAKLTETPYPGSEAPTVAPDELSLTRERVILGTIGWMSPEQASGRPVDSRSDIFAFGILLYELLTGRHPFRRATTVETLAAIREEEPEPPSQLVPALPPDIERAVLRCLAKDPAKRWQSLSDLGTMLQDIKEDSLSGRRVVVDAATPRARRVRWPLVAALVVVVAVISVAVIVLNRHPVDTGPLDLRRLTYDGGYSSTPAISPDGNLIAFASDRAGDGQMDIWIRHIKRAEPVRLTDDPADKWSPRFSPDGSRIVYHSERDGGAIWIVNSLGGEPRKLANRGIFPRFSPAGSVVSYLVMPAYSSNGLLEMFTVPVDGGEPTPLVPGFGAAAPPGSIGPLWSPDGKRVLFEGAPYDDPARRDWWVAPVDGGPPVSSGGMEALPRIDMVQYPCEWLPDRILFLAGTTIEGINLYGASITSAGRIEGPVVTFTSGPGMMWSPSVSSGGRIALSKFQWVIHLWQTEVDLETGRSVGSPVRLTDDDAPKFGFSLSQDGSLLAFSTYSGPRENRVNEVRLRNLENGHASVLETQEGPIAFTNLYPRLSADGTLIAWTARVDRKRVTFVAPVTEPVGVQLSDGVPLGFFSDSRSVLLWQAPNNLVRWPIDGTPGTVVLSPEDLEIIDANLSWDNRWLAVSTATPDGRLAISVVPVSDPPAPESEWIDLDDGSPWMGSPRWSPDGHLLYYLSDRDDFTCIWAWPLDPTTKLPAGDPFPVLHGHRNTMKMFGPIRGAFSVAIGGRRLVFNAAEVTGEIFTATLPEAR